MVKNDSKGVTKEISLSFTAAVSSGWNMLASQPRKRTKHCFFSGILDPKCLLAHVIDGVVGCWHTGNIAEQVSQS